MKVYLLRHGQAEARATNDELRHLTPVGTEHILDIAGQFKARRESIEFCFCSPYIRAQETAQVFLRESGLTCKLQTEDLLTPEGPPQQVLDFLQSLSCETVLLVGHNPSLTALYALLTNGASDHHMKIMAAGELCCISFEFIAKGLGECDYCLLPAGLLN